MPGRDDKRTSSSARLHCRGGCAAACRRRRAAGSFAGVLCALSLLLGGALLGDVIPAEIESPAAVGRVVFPHLFHVEDLGFECRDCHHETLATPLEMPHPEYLTDFWIECRSCHHAGEALAGPRSCADCHPAGGDVADLTLSAKVAIHRSCWQCHEVGAGAEASAACAICHEEANEE